MLGSKNKIAMTRVYVSLLFSVCTGSMLVTFFVICIMQFIVFHDKIDLGPPSEVLCLKLEKQVSGSMFNERRVCSGPAYAVKDLVMALL